jgi:diguanylate cyclase (GGDEF)-like protein
VEKTAFSKPTAPVPPNAAQLLASASLFSSFEVKELDFLAEKSEFLVREDGQDIFAAGDRGDRLYLVASGSVVILSPEEGSVLAEFVKGDSFGELEFLTGTRHNAGARAEGQTLLLAFPSGGLSFKEALSARPEVAARILRSFLLVVAGRTRKSNALVKENSPWVRELRRQVYGDKLTGLLNKAYLEETLPKLLPTPLALLMLKPDNFKEINDRFGHEVGDAVLVLLAGELDRAVGKEGTAIRYMGNELAALYPGMDRAGALERARLIQARLSALDISSHTGDPSLKLSISLGLALSPEHGDDPEALIKAAAGLPLLARSRGGSLILFPEDA